MQRVPQGAVHGVVCCQCRVDVGEPGVELDGVGGVLLVLEDAYGVTRVEE